MDCLLAATVRRADDGHILAYQGIIRDITERKRAERLLAEYSRTLEQRVEERTADLTKANVQLQQEISERKRVEAERERLLVAERAQTRRQAALLRLSAELAATLDEAEVCQRVVDGLHDTLGYDHVGLFLPDKVEAYLK